MNIFQKLFVREVNTDFLLGSPPADEGARNRRFAAMASLNPKGFTTPKKEPRGTRQTKRQQRVQRSRGWFSRRPI